MTQAFVYVLSFLSVVATSHLSRLQGGCTWSFHTLLSAVALYIEPYTQGDWTVSFQVYGLYVEDLDTEVNDDIQNSS